MPEGDDKFWNWWKENRPTWLTATRGWGLREKVDIAELAREAFRAGECAASSDSTVGTKKLSQS